MENIKDTTEKPTEAPKMRKIVIETDGNSISLVSAEVSGKIELMAILQSLLGYLHENNNK